ncbi:MAG: hypothetical protein GDA41_02180 [Rhodospirillales bacterium]|nr:hypothetical protein [Rhodospirillales bacterium]
MVAVAAHQALCHAVAWACIDLAGSVIIRVLLSKRARLMFMGSAWLEIESVT